MLFTIQGGKSVRLVVVAYDIASPKRARIVRKLLDSLHHGKQYSVYEALLSVGAFRGVLAELSACCDFTEDRLSVWWPLNGLRLVWQQGRLRVGAQNGEARKALAKLPGNIGNFIVCYDISDNGARNAVAKVVASQAVMVQRSVYWCRTSLRPLSVLSSECSAYLEDGDRFWIYPLSGSHLLWHVGIELNVILPIANHRWEAS